MLHEQYTSGTDICPSNHWILACAHLLLMGVSGATDNNGMQWMTAGVSACAFAEGILPGWRPHAQAVSPPDSA